MERRVQHVVHSAARHLHTSPPSSFSLILPLVPYRCRKAVAVPRCTWPRNIDPQVPFAPLLGLLLGHDVSPSCSCVPLDGKRGAIAIAIA